MPRSPRTPLLGALVALGLLAVTGLLAYLSPVAQGRDRVTLQGFLALNRGRLTPFFDHVAHLADPAPYALIGFSLAAIALARRRPRTAAAIVFLLLATGITTATLKPMLAHPRYDEWLGAGQIAAASWPSGHATASMTLAFCAVMAVPAALRPLTAAIGAAFAISVSYSILALGWHFPSDVFGGYLVAGMWTLLGLSALLAAEQRWPTRARRDPVLPAGDLPLAAVWAATAGVGFLIALARPAQISDFAREHTTMVVAAGGMAALATVLASSIARAARS